MKIIKLFSSDSPTIKEVQMKEMRNRQNMTKHLILVILLAIAAVSGKHYFGTKTNILAKESVRKNKIELTSIGSVQNLENK
jgi:hypothetical protein